MQDPSETQQRPRGDSTDSHSTVAGNKSNRPSQEAAAEALIVASALHVEQPNEYENRVKESRSGGHELKRVAGYLPTRLVKPCTDREDLNVTYFGALIKLCTGGFLTLSDELSMGGVVDGIKQSVFDENVNLAVISALLLTMAVPMFFEHWEDYLDEDFDGSGTLFLEGYIGSHLEEEQAESVARLLADLSHCAYVVATIGFLFSTLSCVYILLCVNEIGSDNGVQVFLRQMGRAVRLPYIFYSVGMVMFLGLIMRGVFTVRSLETLIIESLIIGPVVCLFLFGSQIHCVRCACHALYEISSHEPLALTPVEVHEDVDLYLLNAGPSAEVGDCLLKLQARTSTGAVVPHSSVTTALIKAAYHRKMSKLMGLDIPDSTIYQITRGDSVGTFS